MLLQTRLRAENYCRKRCRGASRILDPEYRSGASFQPAMVQHHGAGGREMGSENFWLYDAAAIAGVLSVARLLGFWFDRRERRSRTPLREEGMRAARGGIVPEEAA